MQLSITVPVVANPEDVWSYFTEFNKRRLWETDLEALAYDSPIAAGVTGTMKLSGMPEMPFEVVQAVPGGSFWDKTLIPGGALVFGHGIAVADGVTRITQTVRLDKASYDEDDLAFLMGVFGDTPQAAWRLKTLVE